MSADLCPIAFAAYLLEEIRCPDKQPDWVSLDEPERARRYREARRAYEQWSHRQHQKAIREAMRHTPASGR